MDKLQTIRKIVQSAFFIKFVILSVFLSSFFCLCIFGYIEQFILLGSIYFVPVVIVISLLTLIFGRLFCGWMCPLGFIFDLTYKLRVKLSRLKKLPEVPKNIHNKLIYLKYVILILFIILTYYLATYTYCSVCPIGALTNLSGTLLSFIILIGVILLGFIYPMAFCRYLCPIGALLGIFSIKPLFKLKLNNKCVNCKLCERKCPVQINLTKNIDQTECIRCFECVSSCKKDAIDFKPFFKR
ncbi:4Fe-4S ferredoxin iron-sulfur binding domain protein [Methanococcus aeolicus Nankai-3]|uniref:4Fe-4S ferredoxin iron-sulfur binding domain protein n=1 Tax=Methanococcus aeolicus (strain ATCC BAA-1280 / DSM 17508 / OCM 812 / Nankai-3) TaxID=419665 RepID=A6UVE6_META3|nr:4Fe-4S binding protein [Methanococcus aeolicus]ABR56468.1 4Fe-4S ferredoxin iron-sulfur binding domain protein [Methanococcus aeolicus Nankai-3]